MQLLRDILPGLAADAFEALPEAVAAALAWQAAAGPELASRARACGLRGGVLWLACDDAGARAQIESVTPELLRALRRYCSRPGTGPPCHKLQFQP